MNQTPKKARNLRILLPCLWSRGCLYAKNWNHKKVVGEHNVVMPWLTKYHCTYLPWPLPGLTESVFLLPPNQTTESTVSGLVWRTRVAIAPTQEEVFHASRIEGNQLCMVLTSEGQRMDWDPQVDHGVWGDLSKYQCRFISASSVWTFFESYCKIYSAHIDNKNKECQSKEFLHFLLEDIEG